MASFLRQIVAGPRSRHPEAGLDLCYVTSNIIATSGPSGTYPQRAYRNPLDQLVKFLDDKHGDNWAIWEFRAEGTGYPDSEVYDRIKHYPWPDHHPPPFKLIPLMMASMRNWLHGDGQTAARVAVVHCKAGKGRSGTVTCSYLISECGWKANEALARFTERRMRPGFGQGVSIPSQLRWVGYVDRWAQHGKLYVEREIEIVEVHVWGLRSGVRVAIESFVDDGKVIKSFHTFTKKERHLMEGTLPPMTSGLGELMSEVAELASSAKTVTRSKSKRQSKQAEQLKALEKSGETSSDEPNSEETVANAVVFKPEQPIVLPSSDINIDFERRNKAPYGLTVVTSVAHVWWNAYFEGNGPEQNGQPDDSGIFEIEWDRMDGLKGSSRKGMRAMDRLAVVWRARPHSATAIHEPEEGELAPDVAAADWQHGASGMSTSEPPKNEDGDDESMKGVQSSGP